MGDETRRDETRGESRGEEGWEGEQRGAVMCCPATTSCSVDACEGVLGCCRSSIGPSKRAGGCMELFSPPCYLQADFDISERLGRPRAPVDAGLVQAEGRHEVAFLDNSSHDFHQGLQLLLGSDELRGRTGTGVSLPEGCEVDLHRGFLPSSEEAQDMQEPDPFHFILSICFSKILSSTRARSRNLQNLHLMDRTHDQVEETEILR